MDSKNQKLDLLRFWNKLEYLNPAPLPKDPQRFSNDVLPWSKETELKYFVYLGVFESSSLFNFIRRHFRSDEQDPNEPREKYITASIELDSEGKYIDDTLIVSLLPFSLNQLKEDIVQSSWEEDFNRKVDSVREAIHSFLFDEYQLPVVLRYNNLIEIHKCLNDQFSWNTEAASSIYYTTSPVDKFDTKKKESAIVNSQFTKDLNRVIGSCEKSRIPPALDQYLSGGLNLKPDNQIDLNKNPEILQKDLVLDNYPDGCWPSKYTLSMMQQFAVNHVCNKLIGRKTKESIYSVNGPPGSGKTTLLRDIVAANIVNKAKAQSKIKDPKSVFSEEDKLSTWDKSKVYSFYPINKKYKEIAEYGMLVTSSNNSAVENITRELPLKDELNGYEDQARYFSDFAEHFSEGKNWGLISAALGNKENISAFLQTVTDTESGLLCYLEKYKQPTLEIWEGAVERFEKKQIEIGAEKRSIKKLIATCEKLESCITQKKYALSRIDQLANEISILKMNYEGFLSNQREHNKLLHGLLRDKVKAEENRPGFFHWLFKTRKYKTYHAQFSLLGHHIKTEENELSLIENQIKRNTHSQNETTQQLNETQHLIDTLSDDIVAFTQILNDDDRTKEPNFIETNYWINVSSKESQERCPWYLSKLRRLQSELFLLALKVNESFIHAANGADNSPVSTNIRLFAELNTKGSSIKANFNQTAKIWENLFQIIPVLSGTFASIQNMMGQTAQETIPWLFVDEAGQALPQMACGAIWRSRRVIVVGDPLQIEPVNTMPSILMHHLSKSYGLEGGNLVGNESVQNLADKVNLLGANIKSGGRKTCVGTPLKVHRRCIEPMFSIANEIAYDNSMVCATINKQPTLQMATGFLHIEGLVTGRHYVPVQGEIVLQLIAHEIKISGALPNLYVISPFSEVAREIINLLKGRLPQIFVSLNSKQLTAWIDKSVGTVHTFQGKEAEGVILCLGCDQTKISAANWAAAKPNILNVAITRAKFRFIAIGDKNMWLKLSYFKALKDLPELQF